MSKYLDRLIPAWEKSWYGQEHITHGSWVGNKRKETLHRTKNLPATFHEEEYKNFSLIIVSIPMEVTLLLDQSGNPTNSYVTHDQYLTGETYIQDRYIAFAWRIGSHGDDVANLAWVSQFADLQGSCQSASFDKTQKMAYKQLDIYDVCHQVHDRLKEIADIRLYHDEPVINVLKGEEVYVQAHGRLRKGIVVGTTGSRFVVSYVTPSNLVEIKTKTVHLRQVRKGKDHATN
jgi:hypothetical protein